MPSVFTQEEHDKFRAEVMEACVLTTRDFRDCFLLGVEAAILYFGLYGGEIFANIIRREVQSGNVAVEQTTKKEGDHAS